MPTPQTDHESLIALQVQVDHHQAQLDRLDQHERDTLVTVTRLTEHIQGLQHSHEQIQAALSTLEKKQDAYKDQTSHAFAELDRRIADANTDLRDHFDEKIDSWQENLDQRLQDEKNALPQWAKVRMMRWSVSVAILAIILSILEFLHVL